MLLSWFANERRSLKAKLSAQHVLQAFFTETIDGDFQGAALLDAALSNEETCEQKGDVRTCHHEQELRRSVFAELCSSAYCADACVTLMRLMVACLCCQTACPRFVEAVAEQVDAGLPEREFSSVPLDNEGTAPRRGRRSHMDEDLQRRLTSEIFEEGLGHSGQPTARVKRIDGKRLREWQHKDMASHLWAQNRTFECCTGVLVCSRDAARLEKPAEETEVFEVTSHVMNFTTILPNQAHTCKTLMLRALPCRCSAISCCCIQTPSDRRVFEKGSADAIMQLLLVAFFFVCNNCLLHFCGRCACRQRRRLCSVMQALPEWRGQNTQQDGSPSKQGSQKWKQNLCKFLVSKGLKMQKTNLKAKDLANKHHLKACDHAWASGWAGVCELPWQEQVRCSEGARDPVHGAHVVAAKESCKGKLLFARCAAVSRIRALAPRASKRCGATSDEYWSMSRILAPSVSHRCLSSSLIARSGAAISRIRCTGYTTTIATP